MMRSFHARDADQARDGVTGDVSSNRCGPIVAQAKALRVAGGKDWSRRALATNGELQSRRQVAATRVTSPMS
jgi:hypothetical protein